MEGGWPRPPGGGKSGRGTAMMCASVSHAAGSHRQEQEQEPVAGGSAQQREALLPACRAHPGGTVPRSLTLLGWL